MIYFVLCIFLKVPYILLFFYIFIFPVEQTLHEYNEKKFKHRWGITDLQSCVF